MNYKLRRKQFYAWIGAAMLVVSLTACGDNAESKDTPVSDASEVSDVSNASNESDKLKQDDIFTDADKEKLNSALQNENIDQTYSPTSANAQSGKAVAEAVTEAKGYTDTKIGSIDTALDNIIALQNSYIGGNA